MILNAISGSVAPIVISIGGLTGTYLLAEDKSLATLPVSGFTAGVALMAGPASLLIYQIGRQRGFMAGSTLGFARIVMAGIAIIEYCFIRLCTGLLLAGGAYTFIQQCRFAASDHVDAPLKSQAISRVLIRGIASAIVGPQIVIQSQDLQYPTPFAGTFLSCASLFLIGLFMMTLLPQKIPEKQKIQRPEGRTKKIS